MTLQQFSFPPDDEMGSSDFVFLLSHSLCNRPTSFIAMSIFSPIVSSAVHQIVIRHQMILTHCFIRHVRSECKYSERTLYGWSIADTAKHHLYALIKIYSPPQPPASILNTKI
ncbi:CLUMA_CG000625, isoform A [Clunio marinus]|uniref:CLUMA_CG000625, isoform A n=1 Tax=Clunio marinus TaxID=568069 RepID=A0A1J1HGW0_9DIPT|nr:CLUMA_CG000625, isoform A [Clunio marinus]